MAKFRLNKGMHNQLEYNFGLKMNLYEFERGTLLNWGELGCKSHFWVRVLYVNHILILVSRTDCAISRNDCSISYLFFLVQELVSLTSPFVTSFCFTSFGGTCLTVTCCTTPPINAFYLQRALEWIVLKINGSNA